jgi:predicted dehydrogenase
MPAQAGDRRSTRRTTRDDKEITMDDRRDGTDDQPVRLASIGLGWWGNELAKAAERSGSASVAACFARNPDARREFAQTHGCREAASLDDVLADPEIDGLLVATPHSTHLGMIEAAADAGKHVFVEKPLTITVADGKRAVAAAKDAGIVLQVGQHRRRTAGVRAIRAAIDAGELGMVHLLQGTQRTPGNINPREGWRSSPAESPLGAMAGLGVHQLDNFHYLDGRVGEVFATSRRLLGRNELDDVTTLSLEMESGALATLGTAHVLPRGTETTVYGTEGAAWSELDGAEFYVQKVDENARSAREVAPTDPLAEQMAEFAHCIGTGDAPEVGGDEGLEVVVVFEAARVSAAEHRPVSVDAVRRGEEAFA